MGTELMLEAGVSFVGSWCGSTPEHTREIRRMVDQWSASNSN